MVIAESRSQDDAAKNPCTKLNMSPVGFVALRHDYRRVEWFSIMSPGSPGSRRTVTVGMQRIKRVTQERHIVASDDAPLVPTRNSRKSLLVLLVVMFKTAEAGAA